MKITFYVSENKLLSNNYDKLWAQTRLIHTRVPTLNPYFEVNTD